MHERLTQLHKRDQEHQQSSHEQDAFAENSHRGADALAPEPAKGKVASAAWRSTLWVVVLAPAVPHISNPAAPRPREWGHAQGTTGTPRGSSNERHRGLPQNPSAQGMHLRLPRFLCTACHISPSTGPVPVSPRMPCAPSAARVVPSPAPQPGVGYDLLRPRGEWQRSARGAVGTGSKWLRSGKRGLRLAAGCVRRGRSKGKGKGGSGTHVYGGCSISSEPVKL